MVVKTAATSAGKRSRGWLPGGAPIGLLSVPLLLILAIFLFWPLVILALQSLRPETGSRLSFAGYAMILGSERYLRAFGNTALIAVASTLLALLICTPAAIYVEGRGGGGRKLLAVLLTIPLSLPGIVIGFFVILSFGLTGVIPEFIELLTGERELRIAYTFWGLLLGYLYFQIPRVVLVLRGAVATISPDVIDVARTLGTPTWRIYTAIILPSLRPALLNAAALSLATAFGAFGTAATLSRGFRVIPLEIAAAFTESFQPELAAGLSLVLVLVTTTILLSMQWLGEGRQSHPCRR
ncbi:MAG: ABC transporter permease [Chloroflexaceae bacterium]